MSTSALLTVAEVRELIGPLAEGKTDAEIEGLRNRFADFAGAFVALCDGREKRAREAARQATDASR